MAEASRRIAFAGNIIGLFVGGFGLGWLVGLSVTPVLQVIVASIVALAVAATSALAGLKSDAGGGLGAEGSPLRFLHSGIRVSFLPLSLLIVGIATGASAGVFARTNNLLGLDPEISLKRWNGTGIEKKELEKRMFDAVYAPPEEKTAPADDKGKSPEKARESGKGSSQFVAGLYAATAQQCDLLAGKKGADLNTVLLGLGDVTTKAAMAKCSTDECLVVIREMLCPTY